MLREGAEPTTETSLLSRETPLTIEEISAIRLPRSDSLLYREYNYSVEGQKISILQMKQMFKTDMHDNQINVEEHSKELIKLFKSAELTEHGEGYIYENLLANSLLEQLRIAKKFDLPIESIYKSMKLDFRDVDSKISLEDNGFIYTFVLQRHIELLKKDGATDEQILTEVSGHIFHESLHDFDGNLSGVLFGGKRPLGEFTSITGQLAYYLEKGYDGPTSYDVKCSSTGQEKINEGADQVFDHEIATTVAYELLLGQLQVGFPEVASAVETKTSADACEAIVARLSEAERTRLIPVLKEAILQSTDEKKFKEVVARLKAQTETSKSK